MNTAAVSPTVTAARNVEELIAGLATTDGAGVKLRRVLTQDLQRRLDPFLMLDNFVSDDPADYIGGFPMHPHRGFETVTYMIAGRMRHRDSAGHEGLLSNGDVQWMTAGRGLIHSELPEQENGLMEGFQLWLNLPARAKMMAPDYRDIASAEIPEFTTSEGVRVRLIAGHSHGLSGAVARPIDVWPTDPLYLDLHFPADGATFQQPLLPVYNTLVYPYRGSVRIAQTQVPCQHMAILSNSGDGVVLHGIAGPVAARALLIAGRPLGEPIAQYGPFVMNTRAEVMQAAEDYRQGRLG